MSLQNIINGVAATATAALSTIPSLNDINSSELSADAIGRTYADYDKEYARLRVISADGNFTVIEEIDNLLLQSLSEVYLEKMSPVYTFGSPLMYTSGSDARQFVYSATILVNGKDGDGRAKFLAVYDKALRVSQLVQEGSPRYVQLTYRDQMRIGYITTMSVQINSLQPNKVDITFAMFVIDSLPLFVTYVPPNR